jgi:hypothetical protein
MTKATPAESEKTMNHGKTSRFFFFGGWCPHLTFLLDKPDGDFEEKRNYEDVGREEEVSLYYKIGEGRVHTMSCGIPEEVFAHSRIEWLVNSGLFMLRIQFTSDYEARNDVSSTLDIHFINTVAQNILYREIKALHHIHTHHQEEEDDLLTLISLDNGRPTASLSLKEDYVRQRIARHVYEQYSKIKPNEYIRKAKLLLGDSPTAKQLEEAVKLLFKGIGEASFGIAFLGMHGSMIFTDAQLTSEHIKLESAMRSLEALKGRYTFDFMKARKPGFDISEIVIHVTEGVTRGVGELLKRG